MAEKTVGYAAKEAKGRLEKFEFELDSLEPEYVEVEVTHCGVCHSDISLVDGDWGSMCAYPKVPGHEVVGKVTQVGSAIRESEFKPGMRVGVGWWKQACGDCTFCKDGDEQLCQNGRTTCAGQENGGMASKWRGHKTGVFPIPDGLDSETVGPLMCGGVTVYSPLIKFSAPSDAVGVLGVGGLGHMAVKFARARGSRVVALSHSEKKRDEVLAMGAHDFVNTENKEEMKRFENQLGLLIVTVNVPLDWNGFLKLLRHKGTLCFVGAVQEEAKIAIFGELLFKQLNIVGSCAGGRKATEEMLSFAALHGIGAKVEVFETDKINDAFDKVRNGDMHYRGVIKF